MQQPMYRRGFLIGLVALGMLAGVTLTASPAQAASGPGPFYAEPAWDQKFPANTRFLVLTNWSSQAVLDKETGLVWEREPEGALQNWSNARIACTARTTGNRKGWRLPSVHELASLVHPSVPPPGPTLQPGHPFVNVGSIFYWSATTSAEFSNLAWIVTFENGDVSGAPKDTGNQPAWCVRGGMNANACILRLGTKSE